MTTSSSAADAECGMDEVGSAFMSTSSVAVVTRGGGGLPAPPTFP